MTSAAPVEPRNWFYLLLNLSGVAFTVTALAYAVVPFVEQKAREAGEPVPPSPFGDALRDNGWQWLLVEAGLVVVFAAASIGLDRWRMAKTPPTDVAGGADAG